MTQPTISVVIPTYNNIDFLPDTLKSIRTQSYPVSEIIIVDDGSTDDTHEKIYTLGSDLIYIRQQNSGPSSARNKGIAEASGDLVAFCDADDQWTSEKLAEQVMCFNNCPDIALVASDTAITDKEGNILIPSLLEHHGLLSFFQKLNGKPVQDALRRLLEKNFIPTSTVLVKREVLTKAGGFRSDIKYGEDLELWGRIAVEHEIAMVPKVHELKREHETNLTKDITPMLVDLIKVMQAARDWGAEKLRSQGANPNAFVARAMTDLGYRQFDMADYVKARTNFWRSLKERLNYRALKYFIACLLPTPMIRTARRIKQLLS